MAYGRMNLDELSQAVFWLLSTDERKSLARVDPNEPQKQKAAQSRVIYLAGDMIKDLPRSNVFELATGATPDQLRMIGRNRIAADNVLSRVMQKAQDPLRLRVT